MGNYGQNRKLTLSWLLSLKQNSYSFCKTKMKINKHDMNLIRDFFVEKKYEIMQKIWDEIGGELKKKIGIIKRGCRHIRTVWVLFEF